MPWWANNEDAGDLRAFGEADYAATMNEEREHSRQLRFEEEWDREVASGVWYCWGYPRQQEFFHGPNTLPMCESCGKELRREDDGYWSEQWGAFYCDEHKEDEHRW